MTYLSDLDYWIIGTFLVLILLVGLAASRMASRSLEHYFLGGRNLPWYLLGISGMSAWFDLTGTMVITSFLYLLGPRGLYIEFRGGAVLVLAFLLAYTAKWARRSGCMTSAEWNTYRFGASFSGEMVRLVSALVGIITTIGLLAYFVRGATLFMAAVFPVDPVWLTIGILGLASIYTVVAGFYGVVLSDVVQGAIMILGCIVVSILAWRQVPGAEALNEVAARVTGNHSWIASSPAWHVTMPKGYEAYQSLEMAALFYLLRNLLGGMATGGDTRYFASRNAREASLQCLLQGLTVMFRWPLMIGFAILGIYWVSHAIPGGDAISRASAAIRTADPALTESNWQVYTDQVVYHPETAPAGLVDHLTAILGPSWKVSLPMISSRGTVNPEVILPAVLLHQIPSGLRGLLIVALLSALMGALTGQVNTASSLFVRDIYQNFLRPQAATRELIAMAYLSSACIVLSSFLMALAASSINDIWSWFIMSLTAGALGPGLLRLYWWRANAWGMVAGMLAGGAAAVFQRVLDPGMAEWIQFVTMTGISVFFTIAGSLATEETPHDVVHYFYQTTRPFGFWGPFRKELSREQKTSWSREHRNDIRTVCCALVWQVCLFLIPMQVLTHDTEGLLTTTPVFLLCCVGLYFFWWRNLPSPDEKIADFASRPPVHSPEELRELESLAKQGGKVPWRMRGRTLLLVLGCSLGISLPIAHGQGEPSPRGPLAQTWEEAYARMHPFSGPRREGADPSTLQGKVICGYQGWFLAAGDGSGAGWVHYGPSVFKPGDCTVDLWPDMSEATRGESYPTSFHLADGSTAPVFSSYNARTVDRHFKWMADYGIDGAFLQRFGGELRSPEGYDHVNAILDNVRRGANANGRTWAVMYDLSGLQKGEIDSVVIADWKRLVDRMEITRDPSYQKEKGKPVVTIWGVGFDEDRKYTLDECAHLIDFLKNDPHYGGNCVMLGLPYGWREQNRDAVRDSRLHQVILQADIVSPWTVGRYRTIDEFNRTLDEYPKADLAWCAQNKLDYMPVIFPGFRWHNLMRQRGKSPPYGDIDRRKGSFFKAQGEELVSAGVSMLYVAMFDEIDEGTAIFKCSNNPPVGKSDFGTFQGLPPDSYLRLAGQFSQALKKQSSVPRIIPK